MFRRTLSLLAALVLAGAAPTSAPLPDRGGPMEPGAAAATMRPQGEDASAGSSWFALPVLFWLPETRLGFGAAGGLHYHLSRAAPVSSVFIVGAYTLNQQWTFDLAGDLNLPSGVLLNGRARVVHFPDTFYGIGPRSSADAAEPYTRRWAQGILGAEFPIVSSKLRAGPRVDLRGEEIRDVAPGGLLSSGTIEGSNGFTAIGLGGTVTWDTRERPLFPRRGSFVEAWALHYPEGLGRHREFTAANVEGRIFFPLGQERVLGAAAYIEQTWGDVPFTLLPKIGSSRFLRGWREGRFRDRAAWAAQTELRVPIAGPVVGTVFGAVGDVAPDLGAFHVETLKVAGGVGLRYPLTPEGANLRLDVAESRAGTEIYVLLLDAF